METRHPINNNSKNVHLESIDSLELHEGTATTEEEEEDNQVDHQVDQPVDFSQTSVNNSQPRNSILNNLLTGKLGNRVNNVNNAVEDNEAASISRAAEVIKTSI